MSSKITTQIYWQSRAKQLAELRDQIEYQCDKRVAKAYAESAKKLKQLLEATLQEIKDNKLNGGMVTMNDLMTYNRQYDVLNQINQIIKDLGSTEVEYIEDYLTSLYKQNAIELGKDLDLTYLDEAAVKRAVNDIWCTDGKAWTDRVWESCADLNETLSQGLMQCISAGEDSKWLSKYISDTYGVGMAKSQRLVRTEMTHTQNQSSMDRYKEAGVQEYQVLEFRDSDTCEICKGQNGKRYQMGAMSEGSNCPPYHPNCRGTIIPIVTA